MTSGLPDMPRDRLERLSLNAASKRNADPSDEKAQHYKDAIDREYVRRSNRTDGWSTGVQGDTRLRIVDAKIRGAVRRLKTHTATRKDVWICEVDGEKLAEVFHHVDDAREQIEQELHARGAL